MTVMADYASYQYPHHRSAGGSVVPPMTKPVPQAAYTPAQASPQPVSPTHYHSRTASSTIFPSSPVYNGNYTPAGPGMPPIQQQQAYGDPSSHRRMTSSTVSSVESNSRNHPAQASYLGAQQQHREAFPNRSTSGASAGTNLRRSTSSRSQASSLGPSSYVALLRKQKATVWCERTQHTDPRVAQQAKFARQRATHEILVQSQGRSSISAGAPTAGSGGGMLSRNKGKHAAKATPAGGAGANLAAGVGVPMRLSASEVGDEEMDDEGVYTGGTGGVHHRTDSGRSSLTGGVNSLTAAANSRLAAPVVRTSTRLSYGSGTSKPGSAVGITPPGAGTMTSDQPPPPAFEHRDSSGSANSEEKREREMGEVGDMLAPSAVVVQEERLSKDELSRRGSVDERSATMRGAAGAMRLFVANPDADDSD